MEVISLTSIVLCTGEADGPVTPGKGDPFPSDPSCPPFRPVPTNSTSIVVTPVGFTHVPVLPVVLFSVRRSLCVTTPELELLLLPAPHSGAVAPAFITNA